MPGTLVSDLPNSDTQEFLKELQRRGVSPAQFHATRLSEHGMDDIADLFTGRTAERLRALDAARDVLGNRIWGPEEWLTFYSHRPKHILSFPWLDDLSQPCPFEDGKTVAQTHFAFLGLVWFRDSTKFSASKMAEFEPQHFDLTSLAGVPPYHHAWFRGLTCANAWYLLYPHAIPGSIGRPSSQQLALLPPGYVVPDIAEYVIGKTMFWKRTDMRPESDQAIRVGVGPMVSDVPYKLRELAFGRFSFDSSLVESVACGVPAVRRALAS